MAAKTLFDISCENFDLYFAREIEAITQEQKESLPNDITFKLFRRGGAWNSKSTSRLSFLAKLFVLIKAFKKRFVVIVEDDQKGIGLDQYKDIRRNVKQRDQSVQAAEDGSMTFDFYLGDKELMNTMQYLNQLNTGPAYNYLLKNKNVPTNKIEKADSEMAYIVRFLTFWETNRKVMVANTGISIPELYVLLPLFDGKAVNTAFIHKTLFKRAYQSSQRKIKNAFGTLQEKNYIMKSGISKGSVMQITPLGKEVLTKIIQKYAIDC